MHNFVMLLLFLSVPVSAMVFYLIGIHPWSRRSYYPGGQRDEVEIRVCPTCLRPL